MTFLLEDSSFEDLEYEEKIARFTGAMALIRYEEEKAYQDKLKRISAPWAQQSLALKKHLRTIKSERGERGLRAEISQQINDIKAKIEQHKTMKHESIDRCQELNKILADAVSNMGLVSPNTKPFRALYSDNRTEHKKLAEVIYSRYKRQYGQKAIKHAQEKFGDMAESLKPREERKAKEIEKPDLEKRIASIGLG